MELHVNSSYSEALLECSIHGSRYSRMNQVKFVETAFEVSDMVCLGRPSRPYHFKFFKGCLPQILLVVLS